MDESNINEVVSDGSIATSNKEINVSYYRPKLLLRVFANLLDILVYIIVFVFCFLGIREIIKANPSYQAKAEELTQIKVDSGIFAYDDDNILRDIVSVLNNDKGQTAKSRAVRSKKAIDTFLDYVQANGIEGKYQEIVIDYNDYRLDEEMTQNNIPLFVINESNEIVENPALIDSAESVSSAIYTVYYEKAYQPYIDNRVRAYLVIAIPSYKDITNYQTNILLWINIFAVYCFVGLLVYLLPTLIFKRGRMTFGKALYGIGLVDANCLSPSLARNLARFAIFYFSILILSLFTFGLPMLISFSLMVFSKNKQGFADYMLRLNEVDAKRTKIYLSFQEVELEKTSPYKKPVDFKTTNFD